MKDTAHPETPLNGIGPVSVAWWDNAHLPCYKQWCWGNYPVAFVWLVFLLPWVLALVSFTSLCPTEGVLDPTLGVGKGNVHSGAMCIHPPPQKERGWGWCTPTAVPVLSGRSVEKFDVCCWVTERLVGCIGSISRFPCVCRALRLHRCGVFIPGRRKEPGSNFVCWFLSLSFCVCSCPKVGSPLF